MIARRGRPAYYAANLLAKLSNVNFEGGNIPRHAVFKS